MKRIYVILLIIILEISLCFAGVKKEDIIRLESDILNLQNQIRLLQKSVDENGAVSKVLLKQLRETLSKTVNMLSDIKTSQEELAKANDENTEDIIGEIHTLSAKIDDLTGSVIKLSKNVADVVNAIQEMKVKRPKQQTGPNGKPIPLPPDQLYSLAYNDYVQGNYELAIQGFQDFLANYPDHELADNALYYIGDCLFNQGNYSEAVQAFAKEIKQFPKGDKTASAYLKSGLAYLNMNKQKDAVKQFETLVKTFPSAPEANIAIQQLQILGIAPPASKK